VLQKGPVASAVRPAPAPGRRGRGGRAEPGRTGPIACQGIPLSAPKKHVWRGPADGRAGPGPPKAGSGPRAADRQLKGRSLGESPLLHRYQLSCAKVTQSSRRKIK